MLLALFICYLSNLLRLGFNKTEFSETCEGLHDINKSKHSVEEEEFMYYVAITLRFYQNYLKPDNVAHPPKTIDH